MLVVISETLFLSFNILVLSFEAHFFQVFKIVFEILHSVFWTLIF